MPGCVTGKRMYLTKEMAEDALIDAWSRYRFAEGQGPIAVYQCEDCSQFHLTSTGTMNEKLRQLMAEGKIRLQSEATFWEKKLKKR